MSEININRYHLEQADKMTYILSTSLIEDKLKILCQDSKSQVFIGLFTLDDLIKISLYFKPIKNIELVLKYLNGIIEKQRAEIFQKEDKAELVIHLINNEDVVIPLKKQLTSSKSFTKNQGKEYSIVKPMTKIDMKKSEVNYSSNTEKFKNNDSNTKQYSNRQDLNNNLNIPNNFNNNSNISSPKSKTYNKEKELSNLKNIKDDIKNRTQEISSPVFSVFSHAESLYNIDNKINEIKKELSKIQPEKEKISKEIKQISDKVNIYMKEMIAYKKEKNKLTKENTSLKKENKNLKKQTEDFYKIIKEYETQSNLLKNEFALIQKSISSTEEKDKELLKLKNQHETENKELKDKLENSEKEKTELKKELEHLKQDMENYTEKNDIKSMHEEIDKCRIYLQENMMLKNQVTNLESQIKELMNEKIEEEENEEEEEKEKEKEKKKKEVEGDIIHNLKELELITSKLNKKDKKIIINLLYKATIDSDSAEVFHKKCDSAKNTIVLVETTEGKRFGGYTSTSWKGDCIEKKDSKAFIFSFDKMKTYNNIQEEGAIGCYPKFGPVFLGCQIKIFDNALTKGGTTYEKGMNYNTEEDYELNGGKKDFQVKDIEVYEVVFENF